LIVSIGGLGLGWIVYKQIGAGVPDPMQQLLGPVYKVLKNKYYVDEFYNKVFVQPAQWFAETFTYLWIDRKVIDGFLHWIAYVAGIIGNAFRNYIDKPIVNGFGDWVAETTKKLGSALRPIQSGRIQQYMILALVSIAAFTALFYYLLVYVR